MQQKKAKGNTSNTVTLSTSRLWKYCVWIKRFNQALGTWERKYSLNSAAFAALECCRVSILYFPYNLRLSSASVTPFLFFILMSLESLSRLQFAVAKKQLKKKIFWSLCGRKRGSGDRSKAKAFLFSSFFRHAGRQDSSSLVYNSLTWRPQWIRALLNIPFYILQHSFFPFFFLHKLAVKLSRLSPRGRMIHW